MTRRQPFVHRNSAQDAEQQLATAETTLDVQDERARVDATLLISGGGEPIEHGTVIFKPDEGLEVSSQILYAGPTKDIPDELYISASSKVPVLILGLWDCHDHFVHEVVPCLIDRAFLPPSFTAPVLLAMVDGATGTDTIVASRAHDVDSVLAAINAGVKCVLETDLEISSAVSDPNHGMKEGKSKYAMNVGMTPLQAIEASTAFVSETLAESSRQDL